MGSDGTADVQDSVDYFFLGAGFFAAGFAGALDFAGALLLFGAGFAGAFFTAI